MSHNIQKDWELLAVVGDGNLKENRNTKNVNVQAETGGTTGCWYQEREIQSCDLAAEYIFSCTSPWMDAWKIEHSLGTGIGKL